MRNDESPRRNGSIIAEHRWRGLLHLGTRSALIMRMRVVARRCRRVAHAKAARYPRIRVPHIHRVYPGPCIARVVPKAWPSRFLMRDPPVFGTSAETTSVGRSRPESAQTMLRQAFLIAFANSAALALHAPNLQALQRGLHTRLAASSRRRTKFTRLAVYTRLRRPMNPRQRSKEAPSSEAPSPPSSRPSRPPQHSPPR